MYNASKYDTVLLALGVVIIATTVGMALSPTIAIGTGLLGVAIAGYAMFGIPPTERFK